MKLDEITEMVMEKAGSVDPKALTAPPSEECLTRADIGELVADEQLGEATLQKIANHVGGCERCHAVLQLTMREPEVGELDAAEQSVSKAIEGHLSAIGETDSETAAERAVTIVLQWLPGESQPQLAPSVALADETDSRTVTLDVDHSPAYVRLDSPEGTPEGAEVLLEDAEGDEVFCAQADAEGLVKLQVEPGSYRCTVEGYNGPLLFEGDQ